VRGPNQAPHGPWILWIVVLAAVVLPAGGFGYLVTTFLFAFSGGQNRMVEVVNVGALSVIALGVVVAAVAWRLRSPATAVGWTATAMGLGWVAAIVVEWIVSFRLGAS